MIKLDAENFIKLREDFQLGSLLTESSHPKTKNLSTLVHEDLNKAIVLLQSIDKDVFDNCERYAPRIYELACHIHNVKESGGKLFLCGCGATGRLSLAIEAFYRQSYDDDFVKSFMAGGDYALIKSVESFEDSKEFGARQLNDLGFKDGDLLLAITEGGETSFVIGACEAASQISHVNPFFIYCNPDEQLMSVDRSRQVIENDNIKKLNLTTGPMALAGSTRMQASTMQMLAVSLALFDYNADYSYFEKQLTDILQTLKELELSELSKMIEFESNHYKNDGFITYITSSLSAMTVLTDTTERSPTFSLRGFEKNNEKDPALAFLVIKDTDDIKQAWSQLLNRTPRCLEWQDIPFKLDLEELYLFDISEKSIKRRNAFKNELIGIDKKQDAYEFNFGEESIQIAVPNLRPIYQEIALKTILNIQSTLIMGLLGRYEYNMMSYVKPSNLKLIDRCLRYIKEILNDEKISEEELINTLFSEIKNLTPDEAIVLKVVSKFKS